MTTKNDRTEREIYQEEKRLSQRFIIPGATVSYRKERFIFKKNDFDEEFCKLINISRGGIRFAFRRKLKIGVKLLTQLSIPGEMSSLILRGQVRWVTASSSQTFPYQLGVQFNPYGKGKGQNYPGNLVKIIALENKFTEPGRVESESSDQYQIEDS